MIELSDIFDAYYDCRKHKRRTSNALKFELDYEERLVQLWRDINDRTYTIGKSIAFVVVRPKLREVFAADFRDRIVHHLVIRKLEPYFEERYFAENMFSCRNGKGTLFGIRKMQEQIRTVTENYTKDKYILKCDIRGFFMHINKKMLCAKVLSFIDANYDKPDKEDIRWLMEKIIMHCPEKNCFRKSPQELWDRLPKDKSLFTCGEGLGLPIGNLSSQVLANFCLADFHNWMAKRFDASGGYVDDSYALDDKEELLAGIPEIRAKLAEIGLELHPRKFYLQHFSKGVSFIGAILKFDRLYPGKACVYSFVDKVRFYNKTADKASCVDKFVSSINSYLGFLKPYLSYGIKRRIIKMVDTEWWRYAYISGSVDKICKRKSFCIS